MNTNRLNSSDENEPRPLNLVVYVGGNTVFVAESVGAKVVGVISGVRIGYLLPSSRSR